MKKERKQRKRRRKEMALEAFSSQFLSLSHPPRVLDSPRREYSLSLTRFPSLETRKRAQGKRDPTESPRKKGTRKLKVCFCVSVKCWGRVKCKKQKRREGKIRWFLWPLIANLIS